MIDSARHRPVPAAFLEDLVRQQLHQWETQTARSEHTVVDLGGGTGTFAIMLAEQQHEVTVIDPSLDALASLQRRVSERRLSERVRGVQGDATELMQLLGTDATDVLICHRTLDVLGDPRSALNAMAAVVRPGGVLSLMIPQRRAAVLSQALSGHIAAACKIFDDPHRFDTDQVARLVTEAGFTLHAMHGIGVLADHIPQEAFQSEPGVVTQLYDLESRLSQDPAFSAIAAWAHFFAVR
jgi:ubiquinone/menaquinone biosynthesis C-methylase UbiE